ncbi:MAG TPA: hypothetical protein DCS93_30935 [Microscillaceae bacterium]|nr:hypothetical protein [Microscillaceae bacterium]
MFRKLFSGGGGATSELIDYKNKLQELSSMLLINSSRLIDGDFAESAFIYHIWKLNEGDKDNLKDWEFKKKVEDAQKELKMVYTSFNNLTLANPALQTASVQKLCERWEILFQWLRGSLPEVIGLSESGVEDLFSIADISPLENYEPLAEELELKKRFLDLSFRFAKKPKPQEEGILGKIQLIKREIMVFMANK